MTCLTWRSYGNINADTMISIWLGFHPLTDDAIP